MGRLQAATASEIQSLEAVKTSILDEKARSIINATVYEAVSLWSQKIKHRADKIIEGLAKMDDAFQGKLATHEQLRGLLPSHGLRSCDEILRANPKLLSGYYYIASAWKPQVTFRASCEFNPTGAWTLVAIKSIGPLAASPPAAFMKPFVQYVILYIYCLVCFSSV